MTADGVGRWTRLGDDVVRYDGYLTVVRRRYRQGDATVSDWDLLASPDSVVVLPLTDDGRVVCIRQFRPGPDRVVTSLPGGLVDVGESPLEAARRELLEETGWTARSVESAGHSQWPKSTEVSHAVLARGCRPGDRQRLDPHEAIDVVLLTVPDLRQQLRAGGFGATEHAYLALDHAGLLT